MSKQTNITTNPDNAKSFECNVPGAFNPCGTSYANSMKYEKQIHRWAYRLRDGGAHKKMFKAYRTYLAVERRFVARPIPNMWIMKSSSFFIRCRISIDIHSIVKSNL